VRAASSASADDAPLASLSLEEAQRILGIAAGASSEEVLAAKKSKLAGAGDSEARMEARARGPPMPPAWQAALHPAAPSSRAAKIRRRRRCASSPPALLLSRRRRPQNPPTRQIEAAYDALFMVELRKRMTGELEVASSVRFADVPDSRLSVSRRASKGGKGKAEPSRLPAGLVVQSPKPAALTQASAVFGALAAWALAGALLESADAQAADVAGLQLALAGGYSFYTYKASKGLSVGRAAGLTAGCFLAGALLGGALEGWLRVDIVPLGAFASPGVFVTENAILSLWAGALFLL
jgi:hypothetical protein